jgi:short-subunit dehydrogenase
LLATYAASKAFVLSLSEAIRWEARESGVRIVTLCPGPVATEFQEVAGTSVGRKTPGLLPADEVVEAALRKLEAGGGTIVPGTVNRAGTVVARLFPRSWVLPTARWVIEKLR